MRTIEHARNIVLYCTMMKLYFRLMASLDSSFRGQGLLEYALLIVLVGIIVIVALALFGTGVGNLFSNIVANV